MAPHAVSDEGLIRNLQGEGRASGEHLVCEAEKMMVADGHGELTVCQALS